MAKETTYESVLVESYFADNTSGKHGRIHIRPVGGHKYSTNLQVECSKKLSSDYPVGTKFLLRAKLTDREGGGAYLYSHFSWPVEIIQLKT